MGNDKGECKAPSWWYDGGGPLGAYLPVVTANRDSSPGLALGRERRSRLASDTPQARAADCLLEDGPRALELLFRAVTSHPIVPILITDNDCNSCDASAGTGPLLAVPCDKIISQRIDDFAGPNFRPQLSDLWRAFRGQREQEGTLGLAGPHKTHSGHRYSAKDEQVPSWVQDFAGVRRHRHAGASGEGAHHPDAAADGRGNQPDRCPAWNAPDHIERHVCASWRAPHGTVTGHATVIEAV